MSIKNIKPIYRSADRTTDIRQKEGVTYLTYRIFEGYPLICAISTRLGGVSSGPVGTMNMSATRGDDPACVAKNHRLFAMATGYDPSRLVMSDQIHKTRILKIEEKDAGSGVKERGVDGLITDVPDLPLMTFYADCVPLMFYDTVHHVVAMAHSGWRGTVAKIGKICLEQMKLEYGTNAEDVLAAIGPSICQKCYEVDEPLRIAFAEEFGDVSRSWFMPTGDGKHYDLDLAGACCYTLREAGIPKERIALPDLCTCCNPEFLFSHRARSEERRVGKEC